VTPTVVSVSHQKIEIESADYTGAQVVIQIDQATADRLAQHRADRLASALDILADEAKELARPIMDALIDAGHGQ